MTDAESIFLSLQSTALAGAVDLLDSGVNWPNLERYYPKSRTEIDIQQFNLHGKLPSRLTNEEDVAMWFLETAYINRTKVCEYLGSVRSELGLNTVVTRLKREDIPKAVLRAIACKVCSLEIARGFVEGLKLFIPVVGCWDLLLADGDGPDNTAPGQRSTQVLQRILTEYVLAHMQYSDRSLFPAGSVSDANVAVVVQVALCVLSLGKELQEGTKSTTSAMADFFAALRAVLREQQQQSNHAEGAGTQQLTAQPSVGGTSVLNLSMKAMTDLFTSTSTGLPFGSLTQAASYAGHRPAWDCDSVLHGPSYLFADCALQGVVAVGTNLEEPFTAHYARLGADALYLFDQTIPTTTVTATTAVGIEKGRLVACLPLESVHLRTADGTTPGGAQLLTLVPLTGRGLPYITYTTTSYHSTVGEPSTPAATTASAAGAGPQAAPVQCAVAERVEYPAKIYLRFASEGQRWVDALEAACWECRAGLSKRKL